MPRETRKTFDTMNETARVRGSKVHDKSGGEMSRGSESILRGGDSSYEQSARAVRVVGTLCQIAYSAREVRLMSAPSRCSASRLLCLTFRKLIEGAALRTTAGVF